MTYPTASQWVAGMFPPELWRRLDYLWTIYSSPPKESLIIAAGDETSSVLSGAAKVTFRMPYAFTLTDIRASLTTAQTSGSIFTVNVKRNGTTVLSTKITIDNNEDTSVTAVTPPVLSVTSLADDDKITVDVDQIGNGTATGLKVTLIGRRT